MMKHADLSPLAARYVGAYSKVLAKPLQGVSVAQLQLAGQDDLERAIAGLKTIGERLLVVVPTGYADRLRADQTNLHQTVENGDWWLKKLQEQYPHSTALPFFDQSAAFFATWPLAPAMHQQIGRAHRLLGLRQRLSRSVLGRIHGLMNLRKRFLSDSDILESLNGKTVAVVGNARSLAAGRHGVQIDSADIVIRFNASPIVTARSHGLRTDWIATGMEISPELVRARGATTLLWMFKPRRIPGWMYGFGRLYAFPMPKMRELETRLGSRPTSGFLIIDLLARSNCQSVRIYGFDFFATLSTSGTRTKDDVPHDFSRERQQVTALVARDMRFKLA